MKRVFNFGKVDYFGQGTKENLVLVEMELKDSKKGPVFTCSGSIQNRNNTDALICGQCLDNIREYLPNNPLFETIYELWKNYHLNDLNAGTIEQTKALKEAREKGFAIYDYCEICEYLKSIDLYEVEHEGKPYKYGYGWIYYEIPEEDLTRIRQLLAEN